VVPSPEANQPTTQPVNQSEEKSSVAPAETAVQKCRRKQKENEVALKEKDLALSAEQTERIEKMLELKGELNILSRLSGASPCQEIQDCINKVAEDERKIQERRETATKTLRGDKKKRKVLELLEEEVSAKKKRIAELDENFEKGTNMKTVMTHNLMQRLRC